MQKETIKNTLVNNKLKIINIDIIDMLLFLFILKTKICEKSNPCNEQKQDRDGHLNSPVVLVVQRLKKFGKHCSISQRTK